MSFHSLGLEPRLLAGVSAMGYADPTAVQREAIPHVLAGSDLVGVAQTGTGKTAAFVLPMLQRIPPRRGVRALIVTPTRELALQIAEVVRAASHRTGHRAAVIIGGVGMQPQVDRLRRGVDVVIACPGRLLDVHSRGAVDLSRVETLVLDEADRMLDMGFWPDVRRILALLPPRRQNLLFSATMSSDVLGVVRDTLRDPVRVQVAPPATPVESVEQVLYPVSARQKTELLAEMLKRGDHRRTLVFTRTKSRADRLHRQLERRGVASAPIHGGRSQGQRQRALEAFKAGRSRVLVATDVLGRGIDIDDVSHVVNYDLPHTPEDYVHRIGRTARAGASGTAISLLAAEELETLAAIEKVLGAALECRDVDGFRYEERVVPAADRRVTPAPRGETPRSRTGRRGGRGRAGARRR
ncbi:MAG: DEAD/DEAH box helicase [Coriobacteriia bacterium]|nr:DEAD/DEAH box helicase [Coriobacteriia bacterium]